MKVLPRPKITQSKRTRELLEQEDWTEGLRALTASLAIGKFGGDI